MLDAQITRPRKRMGARFTPGENEILALNRRQLDEYVKGQRQGFSMPLHMPGTELSNGSGRRCRPSPTKFSSRKRRADHHVSVDVRGQEQHGIDPVEHAAVAGQDGPRVLDSGRALDERFDQVTHLAQGGTGDR